MASEEDAGAALARGAGVVDSADAGEDSGAVAAVDSARAAVAAASAAGAAARGGTDGRQHGKGGISSMAEGGMRCACAWPCRPIGCCHESMWLASRQALRSYTCNGMKTLFSSSGLVTATHARAQ